MKTIGILSVFLLALLMIGAGCTETPTEEPATAVPTTLAPTATETASPTTTPHIDQIPKEKSLAIQVEKDEIFADITVTFNGGDGQYLLDSLHVKTTLSDGQVIEEELGINRGDEIKFDGTKDEDRIEVTAYFVDGTSYRVYDKYVPFR